VQVQVLALGLEPVRDSALVPLALASVWELARALGPALALARVQAPGAWGLARARAWVRALGSVRVRAQAPV